MTQNTALPTYSALYAFGDSLSDAGNLSITTGAFDSTEPVSPPYYQENYSGTTGNVFSNGPTWVQTLSIALGLGTLAPSLAGGMDFAYGGAETGLTPQNTNFDDADLQLISLPSQLLQFEAAVPHPSANALYTLSIGANDLLDILSDSGLSAQQQTKDVNASVANAVNFVKQLVGDGAKNLLFLDVPDLGKTPDIMTGAVNGSNTPSAALDTLASQLASEYNTDLIAQLATIASADTVDINVVNGYQLIDNAVADPSAYGLTNVTSPTWTGNYTSANSGTLTATSVAAQDQDLFWDHLHPTETGHQALASLAEQTLTASESNPGLAVADTTTNHPMAASAVAYVGPVSGLQEQYINVTTDSLNVSASTPDWFIHTGSGNDAIAVSSGTNVLDGGTGSNFLTGGSGTDTFFVDDRGATAAIWSTVNSFHAGDAATVWGVTPSDFTLAWVGGQGAAGYTGLTLHATATHEPTASLTLAGYTTADLTDGRLTISYGTDAASGSSYMYIQANS